jgi:cobalt-zinc-cadmium efflux system outer membrane protein
MPISLKTILLAAALLVMPAFAQGAGAAADSRLGPAQLVEIAIEANPQVKAARARWRSAEHQIKQNYAPADPIVGYANVDSPTNAFTNASLQTYTVQQALQFPGKAILQACGARRTAEIARLAYEAVIRDVRAQTETAYYQFLLDSALADVQAQLTADLKQVMKVTQVAYSASQVTQTDFISSEFDLAAARQSEMQLRTAELNDETALNQSLFRPPDEPLALDRRMELKPVELPLDRMIDLAAVARQEILETALAERNSRTALELAKLEYAPDYTLGYTFDHYLVANFAPALNHTEDHGVSISFNLPLFFWMKQREDVTRARSDLEAARNDLASIRSQTAAGVTTTYRNMRLAYQTAALYRDSLIPLARQDFQVGLVSYESGKIDFMTLAGTLQRSYGARTAYLQAANQFLAARVALEQEIGEPLPQ